jgi:hypothetical protein
LALGCGMRTLDLVDERASTTGTQPAEAAAPDVSDTDTAVVTSGSTQATNSTAVSSTNPSSAPSGSDSGGGMLPDAGTTRDVCTGDTPFYDPLSGGCMECQFDFHCAGMQDAGLRVCQWGGACVPAECESESECPPGFLCSSGRCMECRGNFDCEMRYVAEKEICDPFSHLCRGCDNNYECNPNEPVCDRSSRVCRGCVGDYECPTDVPVCSSFGRCVAPTAGK